MMCTWLVPFLPSLVSLAQTEVVSLQSVFDFTIIAGKSNLIDAISFALAIPYQGGKHKHTRELLCKVSSSNPPSEAGSDVFQGMQQN